MVKGGSWVEVCFERNISRGSVEAIPRGGVMSG